MPLQSEQAIDENTQGAFLSLQNVTKQFDQHIVLQDLNLDIRQGEFVAIIGKSGCGKSTLLRLLAGLDQSSAGNILVDYEALSKKQEDIRLMFQNSRLLPWKKVIDNIGLGLKGDWKQKALESLKSVGLEDKETFWPASLSGGQQQRISLARALIHQPRLLLLDEPLGALDALTRIEMQQLIEKLWLEQGFTAIIVTHDVSEAVIMADRVILLEQGKIGLDLEINLPRPRRRGQKEVAEFEGYLLDHILEKPKISLI